MSCYSPLSTWRGIDPDTGEVLWHFLGKYDPERAKVDNDSNYKNGEFLPTYYKIPCGKCLGCKLDYSRSWADRMLMEYYTFDKKAIFLTLTYNNENLPVVFDLNDSPIYGTLRKKDLQDFLKRLRFHFGETKIRYFACGEYGSPERTFRPHYHLIVFGLFCEQFLDRYVVQKNELGQLSYSSKELEALWPFGFISFSPVSFQTMSYVSRYSAKKVFGDNLRPGIDAEETFVCMSRRPGLGHDFIMQHDDFFEKRKMFLNDGNTVKTVYFPRYGNKILDKDNSINYYEHVRSSVDLSVDRDLLKLWKTDLPYDQMLAVEEREKQVKVARLLRHRKEI